MSLPEQCSMEMSVQSAHPPFLHPSSVACVTNPQGDSAAVQGQHMVELGATHTQTHRHTLTNTAFSLCKYGIFALNKLQAEILLSIICKHSYYCQNSECCSHSEGTILHIHTSAAVTEKVQWTLQIEALLRFVSVVVVQQGVGAASSPSHIILLT